MNEPEISKEPDATPDPVASSPTPTPGTEPFVFTFHRMWARLKAHKVVQWTLAYLAIAYTLLHGAEMLAGTLNWSHGLLRIFTLILILGVPVIITLAWYHGARGLQRVSGTEVMIIAILLALGGALLWRDQAEHGSLHEDTIASPQNASAPAVSTVAIAPPPERSIAVLPFADMSAQKDQEYMSDGIAEEILNLLAQVRDLKVIARTSSFPYKGQNLPAAEIARQLNVAYVLEGSVRKSGDTLRITAQLIHASDNSHRWSEKYDRSLRDIFAVQDEIANAIVQALQIKLTGGTLNRREGGTQDFEAYQLYMRAGDTIAEGSRSSLDAADDYLNQALKLDPNFGRAWSRRADVVAAKVSSGNLATEEAYELYGSYVHRALEISPDIAEAHVQLAGLYKVGEFDWAAADREAKLALEIDPNNPRALAYLAENASIFGDYANAERFQKLAIARDPKNPDLPMQLARTYAVIGRLKEAETTARAVLEEYPNREWTSFFLSMVLLLQNRLDEAFSALEKETNEGARKAALPLLLHAAGRTAEADSALKEQIDYWADEWAVGIALVYAYRGDRDEAMEWLERGYRQRDTALLAVVDNPFYKSMYGDPRFQSFVRDKLKVPRKYTAVADN